MTSEWQAKVEEMLENLHMREKESGRIVSELNAKIKLLEISVETQRVTITVLASQSRNVRN